MDGNKVRKFRLVAGMTQKELAEKAGTTENAVSLIESGKRNPRPSTIKKIAEALNVPVEDILRDEEKAA